MAVETLIADVIPFVKRVITKRLVPMIHGSPAIGKSDIVKQIAAEAKLWVIDIRLSMYDPADLNGLPFRTEKNGRQLAEYLPFGVFPTEDTPIPEGYKGWLIFMDELPSAVPAVQAAAFKLILDREVGQHKLHPMAFMVAAGNTEDDGAIVNPLPTPLQSRMINFKVKPELKSFLAYALKHGLDYRIAAFLEFKPEYLYKFDPNHDDLTYSSPRTLMFLSKLINGETVTRDDLPLVAGTIGQAAANEFISFVKLYDEIAKISDIVANPLTAKCPTNNPSLCFAMAGSLSQHATKKNLPAFIQYAERMDMEYQIITLRQILGRHPDLMDEECMEEWINKYSSEIWN